MSIRAELLRATEALAATSESARLDAELILAHVLDASRAYLVAHSDDVLEADARKHFYELLDKRLDGVPVAYLTGTREFWSLSFVVNEDVLVPRPETEKLVELAIERLPEAGSLADLGCGSGAVAIAVALERPDVSVTATDRSPQALAVARRNAERLGADSVEFLEGDWTAPLNDRTFDLIVSNPPYVAEADPALALLKHEPRAALAAGPDGLDDIRRLAATTALHLRPQGQLLLEHGAGQQDAVADILAAAGWGRIECLRDDAGRPRNTQASHAHGQPL